MSRRQDIDILAFALRIAIADQTQKAEWRKNEGSTDIENGCRMQILRLRKELDALDEQGAVEVT